MSSITGVSVSDQAPDPDGRAPLESDKADTGRAVGRLDGIGWGSALRELFRPGAQDAEVPVPLRHAAVQTLDAWLGPRDAPNGDPAIDGVVWIDSATRAHLIGHLARGLAKYRGWPVLAGAAAILAGNVLVLARA